MSAEPSMEDILSSIKRIISEEGEPGPRPPRRAPRPMTPTPVIEGEDGDDQILELSDPIDRPGPRAVPPPPPATPAPIASPTTTEAARGSLDNLSRLLVRPDPAGDGTLEGLVRDLLRPMLREWIDAHLPAMVETMVSREIERITGSPR